MFSFCDYKLATVFIVLVSFNKSMFGIEPTNRMSVDYGTLTIRGKEGNWMLFADEDGSISFRRPKELSDRPPAWEFQSPDLKFHLAQLRKRDRTSNLYLKVDLKEGGKMTSTRDPDQATLFEILIEGPYGQYLFLSPADKSAGQLYIGRDSRLSKQPVLINCEIDGK